MGPPTQPDPRIFDTTSQGFAQEVLERSRTTTVAVDFWAAWCGPCRALAPLLEQLVRHYGGRLALARVDVDSEPAIATQYGVRSIPDVRIFRDGKLVDGFVGVQPLPRLQALFDKHVPRATDQDLARARELLAAGEVNAAIGLLRKIAENDGANIAARVTLADAMARLGDADAAEEILDALPAAARAGPAVEAVRARIHFLRHAPPGSEAEALQRAAVSTELGLGDAHRLAAHELVRGDPERGLAMLLGIMQRDRKYQDDLGRRSLLQGFALLGEDDERVKQYRRRMAGLLH